MVIVWVLLLAFFLGEGFDDGLFKATILKYRMAVN